MSRPPDELDLLHLIEGDFDPAAEGPRSAEVRRAVAAHVTLAATMAQVRSLRDELRRLPPPALPCDFVTGLEPLLAPSAPPVRLPRRPSALAAAFSHGWSRSWSRLAMAAAIGAAATGGVWLASTSLQSLRERNGDGHGAGDEAIADAGTTGVADTARAGGRDRLGMSGARPPGSMIVAGTANADVGSTASRATIGRTSIAMVIESNEPKLVEAALRRLVAEHVGDQGALVRNFTTDEALALASRMIRHADDSGLIEPPSPRGADGPVLADRSAPRETPTTAPATGSPAIKAPGSPLSREAAAGQRALLQQALAEVKRDRALASERSGDAIPPVGLPPVLGRDRGSEHSAADMANEGAALGALLAGSRDAAPSPESQLAFGDGDFTLTLSVPAGLLSSLLVELTYEGPIRGVALQPLDVGERPSAADAARWERWHEAVVSAAADGRIAVPIRIVPVGR